MASKNPRLETTAALVFAIAAVLLPQRLPAQTADAPKNPPKSIAERAAEASQAAARGNSAKPTVLDVIDAMQTDRLPQIKLQRTPVYPFEMRRDRVTGEVVIQFVVDKMGDVRDVTVVRSTREEFEASAINAVSQWKFAPGIKAGREVNTRMRVPIVFSLDRK